MGNYYEVHIQRTVDWEANHNECEPLVSCLVTFISGARATSNPFQKADQSTPAGSL